MTEALTIVDETARMISLEMVEKEYNAALALLNFSQERFHSLGEKALDAWSKSASTAVPATHPTARTPGQVSALSGSSGPSGITTETVTSVEKKKEKV